MNIQELDGTVEEAYEGKQDLVESALEQLDLPVQRVLSTFERVFTTHAPILESLLLQIPTHTILRLYQTSQYLRSFLSYYPTAWKYLSFRLLYPSNPPAPGRPHIPGIADQRHSQPYALDHLLDVVLPFSSCLKSLELDNTAVSGATIYTVLHSRRERLEHLSVRGCKNVSLKYHIIPYLNIFGLQCNVDMGSNPPNSSKKHLALKSLYTYRCRHHRRRPYLSTSLLRKESDSEPTHELVNLCHKLGIWTDTVWCSTPAGRCLRRRGYVSMRAPHGSPEVWVVFDRLWRSKNWIGPVEQGDRPSGRDVRLWEHDETGWYGEALGTGEGRDPGDGKMLPTHLRRSHTQFVENIRCDNCFELIHERCEQCSILMHCVGCRKTLCASCAYDRPYPRSKPRPESRVRFWWAPSAPVSPCLMQDPPGDSSESDPFNPGPLATYPALKFHWCCKEPIFSGGGGINIGTSSRDVDQVRAVPLPRGQGWEDLEYSANEWTRTFPRYAYGDPKKPDYSLEAGHIAMVRWLLGPPHYQVSRCPRNLCQECYDSPQWKVHCKTCSKPLCIEHDLRDLRLRICGYRDLAMEKASMENSDVNSQRRTEPPMRPQSAQASFSSEFGLPYRSQQPDDSPESSFTDDLPGGTADVGSILSGGTIQPDLSSSATRGSRNFSATNSNRSRSSSPSSASCESPSETPKWLGCQSFFCPQSRTMEDQRQRCSSVLRECTLCGVYVCQDCIKDNPPCNCSYCDANYACPNCKKQREQDGTCRRTQEEKARRERRWKKDMEELESILKLKLANEIVKFAGQFFNYVENRGEPIGDMEDDEHHDVFLGYHLGDDDMPVDMEAGATPIEDSQ